MTYMTSSSVPQDQIVSLGDGLREAPRSAPFTRIPRMGARPLVFQGVELGMAMSFSPAIPYWYEINLYRTSENRFVLAVRQFFQSEEERDAVTASEHDTIDDAMEALLAYDAGRDIRVTVSAMDPDLSAVDLAACALDLRARAEAARRHFGGLVGEFLHEIDRAA